MQETARREGSDTARSFRPRVWAGYLATTVPARRAGRPVSGRAVVRQPDRMRVSAGGPPAHPVGTIGPAGTVVLVSGDAGAGCVVGQNWPGFDFEPYGDVADGPLVQMTTPVATNGVWSATFVVPSFLGGSPARGPGAPTRPGRYEFVAPQCTAPALATASFQVTAIRRREAAADFVGIAATADGHGYWLAQADGGVAAFGDAEWQGSLPAQRARPTAPIVGIARAPGAKGYWLAAADGRVYGFGGAHLYGPPPTGPDLSAPVTAIAATPDGKGYWLLGADGTVHGFGDARFNGSAGQVPGALRRHCRSPRQRVRHYRGNHRRVVPLPRRHPHRRRAGFRAGRSSRGYCGNTVW